MKKKAVFAALILMILMILGNIFNANSVNAYQLIGFKWSNPDPVTYYLNGNTYTNSAFNSSINDWNNALPSGVSLQRVYNNFHDSQDGRDGLFYMTTSREPSPLAGSSSVTKNSDSVSINNNENQLSGDVRAVRTCIT
jgi:hypothetical protein